MNEFVELPISNSSIANRRLVCGIGINDSTYMTSYYLQEKQVRCPFYATWKRMLTRCYSEKALNKNPTYKNCYVCDEWLVFSVFKTWMMLQDWKDKELDKDLLSIGNKCYSPDFCIFVNQKINTLFSTSKHSRGIYKLGVCWNKSHQKYQAKITMNSKIKHLGFFDTEQEAHKEYCKIKALYIKEIAEEQFDLRLKNALINRANRIHLEE